MSKLKKQVAEVKESNGTELDVIDKGIINILDIPGICKCLSHWRTESRYLRILT